MGADTKGVLCGALEVGDHSLLEDVNSDVVAFETAIEGCDGRWGCR